MTFPQYYQTARNLITEQINLPFNAPYSQTWIDSHESQFKRNYQDGLTPGEAVTIHFAEIEERTAAEAEVRKENKKSAKKQKN